MGNISLSDGKYIVSNPKKKSYELIPISVLVLLVLVVFARILISRNTLFGSDFVLQFYGWKGFVYDYVRGHSSLPFWNPYLFSGTPFIANIQASVFYPLGLLYYLIPPEQAYLYSTILHCILGCIFMYTFMRALSVSQVGSFLSAIIFIFNGYFMGHLYAGHLSFVQNYIWIPLIFRFLYRFVQTIQFRYAVITGLVLGIQILGGFPQIAFYTILGILVAGLYYGMGLAKAKQFRSAATLGLGLSLMIITGFALSAVQVLPTLEFSRLSTRAGGISYAFATFDSLHPKELISFLFPDIFGNVVDETYWRSGQGSHFWETCAYVGVLPFFLIFFIKNDSSLRKFRQLIIFLTIFSIFLALGKHNPLYPIIYKFPGFNNFRIPAQIIFLYVFGMAVMSGIGLNRLQEENISMPKGLLIALLPVGVIILSFLVCLHFFPYHFFSILFMNFAENPITNINFDNLYRRISFGVDRTALLFFLSIFLLLMKKDRKIKSRLLGLLVIGILMIDLGAFGIQFIKPYGIITTDYKSDIIERLNRDPAQGRVVTLDPVFMPNDGLVYSFPSILGYDPLILKRYAHYIQSSQDQNLENHVVNLSRITNQGSKLIKMLNARQSVARDAVMEIGNEIPYAYIVTNAVVKPVDDVLQFMKSDQFSPERMVVFEEGGLESLEKSDNGTPIGTCEILEYKNEEILIRAVTDRACYLVLSEIYYPGWQAKVDGKSVPIQRGNYLFRVIPLEKGEHMIFLYFVSWPFRIGVILSLLMLAGSLVFIFNKRVLLVIGIRKSEVGLI